MPLYAEQIKSVLANGDQQDLDWLRGSGRELEMRFRGTVSNEISKTSSEATVTFTLNYLESSETFSTKSVGGTFDIWLPIGNRSWHYMLVEASDEGGNLTVKSLPQAEWRQASSDGFELRDSNKTVLLDSNKSWHNQ